jgi:hypothetical protein
MANRKQESRESKWYLAEIVTEITIVGESEKVVHNNLVLIRADSAEKAYSKAITRGREMEDIYEDSEGQKVQVTYRGLSDLNIIQDELEDGAEIAYEELVDLSEDEIREMLTEKDELGVFQAGEQDVQDHHYEPQDVLDEAMRIIRSKRDEEGK